MLQNRRQQFLVAGEALIDDSEDNAHEPQAGVVLSIVPRQEKAMETMQSNVTALPTGTAASGERRDAATNAVVFKVRYGRCALALAGLLLLLTAVVTGVLRVLDLVSGWLPVIAAIGAFGSVFFLRRLAIRDRRAKVNAAFRSAMAPVAAAPAVHRAESAAPVSGEVERPQTKVFDAEAEARAAKRLTAVELRQAALKVAVAAGDESAQLAADVKPSYWEPVDVPKPTYVDAAKAPRPAPEPLALPEAPKPVGKPTLKKAGAAVEAPAANTQHGKAQSALSNLDDVLQRRRA